MIDYTRSNCLDGNYMDLMAYYKRTFEWKDFCKYNLRNSDGSVKPMNVSTMLSSNVADSSGDDNIMETFSMLFEAIAYTHIKELKLINSAHALYPGMINEVDIDQFSLTPIGEKIMGYIDLEEKEHVCIVFFKNFL